MYRVTDAGDLETVLHVEVPGDARAWTPAADRCPEPGARYAWAIRSRGDDASGAWSQAFLFETARSVSDDEVRRALRVLRGRTHTRQETADVGVVSAPEGDSETPRFDDRERGTRLQVDPQTHQWRALTAQTTGVSVQPAAPPLVPSSISFVSDGDLDLGGYIFKDGVPFIHNDGGPTGYNTAMGLHALERVDVGYPPDGHLNTAFGFGALEFTSSGWGNTGSGNFALHYNTKGMHNTATGDGALAMNTIGNSNTAFGRAALLFNTWGSNNTAIGSDALRLHEADSDNTAVGRRALYDGYGNGNTAIGTKAAYGLGGSHNTAIGWEAGSGWGQGANKDNIAIGRGAEGTSSESGTIRIGGGNFQSRTFIEGIRGASGSFDQEVCTNAQEQLGPCTPSSLRFKKDVATMGEIAAVGALRPVTFRYKDGVDSDQQPLQYGLIAEEVAKLFPTLVSYDEDGSPRTVRYSLLTPLLLNEVQRQDAELEALREQMTERDRELAELRRSVEKLAKKKRFR